MATVSVNCSSFLKSYQRFVCNFKRLVHHYIMFFLLEVLPKVGLQLRTSGVPVYLTPGVSVIFVFEVLPKVRLQLQTSGVPAHCLLHCVLRS